MISSLVFYVLGGSIHVLVDMEETTRQLGHLLERTLGEETLQPATLEKLYQEARSGADRQSAK